MSKISEKVKYLRSEHEIFNGTHCEDFKVIISSQFELSSITGDIGRLQCFFSRMESPVKVIWEKMTITGRQKFFWKRNF